MIRATALRSAPLLAAALLLASCGAPPKVRTTFLGSVDLVEMTDRMAESLATAPAIAERDADAAPWVLSMERVANYTNQIIPDREKWLYLARLRALLAQTSIARDHALVWVIPPERWTIVREELPDATEPYGLRLPPTHQVTAEFHALTATSASGRSDTYVCAYQLIDLATGTILWEDRWETKRAVAGTTWD